MEDLECVLLDRLNPVSSAQEKGNGLNSPSFEPSIEKFTKESIMLSLKYKRNEYTIVDKNSNSICWKNFGLPARILAPGKYEIIQKFASCKFCFQTYSYTSSTSTLSHHKCSMLLDQSQPKLNTVPVSQVSTTASDQNNKTNTINAKSLDKHKQLITSAISDWVCYNTRPVNIIEDVGLRNLIDQCIKTGNFFRNI